MPCCSPPGPVLPPPSNPPTPCTHLQTHCVQDGGSIEDFINSTCAPSSPTKVINHSDPVQPSAPAARLPGLGQVRAAQPLPADMVQPPLKRRRTSSSAKPCGSQVPAAVGNSTGIKADSPRQQSLANPIDHIFQFHKVGLHAARTTMWHKNLTSAFTMLHYSVLHSSPCPLTIMPSAHPCVILV